MAQDSAHGQELVDDTSAKDVKKFRETVKFIFQLDEIILKFFLVWITTSRYAEDNYFSLENIHKWIRPVAFKAWYLWFRQANTEASRPSSTMSYYTTMSVSR